MIIKFLKYSVSDLHIVVFLLFLTAIFNQYIYIGYPFLQGIRLFLPFAILFIVRRNYFKLDNLGTFSLFFYLLFFITTTISSLLYFNEIKFNDYFNFVTITLFSLVLILFVYIDAMVFLRMLFKITIIYFVLALALAIYEVATLNHLMFSKFFTLDKAEWWHHLPTGFNYNPNDFASTVMLVVLFLISYLRIFKIKLALWIELAFLFSAGWLAYATQARLVQFIFIISLITYYWKYLFRLKFVIPVLLVAFAFLYFFQDHIERMIVVQNLGETVGKEIVSSNEIRLNLLKYGLLSVKESWGIGFGCFNYDYYYTSLSNFPADFRGIYLPHLFFIEILLNGGIIPLLAWILMYIIFANQVFMNFKNIEIRLFVIVLPILYASSSSSLFNFSFYIYYIAFIAFIQYNKNLIKENV